MPERERLRSGSLASTEDDALALKIVNILNDDRVLDKMREVLYPRELTMKIDELVKTLNAVFHRVEILEKSMATKRDIDIETNIVVARIVDVERDVERLKTTVHPAFDPEVTLVAQGLKESGRDLLSDVK